MTGRPQCANSHFLETATPLRLISWSFLFGRRHFDQRENGIELLYRCFGKANTTVAVCPAGRPRSAPSCRIFLSTVEAEAGIVSLSPWPFVHFDKAFVRSTREVEQQTAQISANQLDSLQKFFGHCGHAVLSHGSPGFVGPQHTLSRLNAR
jgi:hypothetical protein